MYMDLLKRKKSNEGKFLTEEKGYKKTRGKKNKVKSNQVKKQKSKKVTRERSKGRKGTRDNKG